MDSIAITGFSFKLPQGAEDDSSFWEILENRRNVMTSWPEARANLDAFYSPESTSRNTVHNSPEQSRGRELVTTNMWPAIF